MWVNYYYGWRGVVELVLDQLRGEHLRDCDCPRDSHHPRMVTVLGMTTNQTNRHNCIWGIWPSHSKNMLVLVKIAILQSLSFLSWNKIFMKILVCKHQKIFNLRAKINFANMLKTVQKSCKTSWGWAGPSSAQARTGLYLIWIKYLDN